MDILALFPVVRRKHECFTIQYNVTYRFFHRCLKHFTFSRAAVRGVAKSWTRLSN